MDLTGYTVGGFELSHLIVIFILFGCALFIIYWLWIYPCNDSRAQETPLSTSSPRCCRSGRVLSRPEPEAMSSSAEQRQRRGEMILYATEIEPGTVVLQSPNGDLFRILREYDSITENGSPTSGLPPGTSLPVHYIPAYTRVHVQNQASAPPYPGVTEERSVVSPTSETWRPLYLQSGLQQDY